MDYIFTEKEFRNLVFNSKPFDKDFLKKWNNKMCIGSGIHEWTPVEWVASHGRLDMIKFLVENSADITLVDNYTIKTAIRFKHICVIKYLLSTNIYSEEFIHKWAEYAFDPDIKELLVNYTQFPRTKAAR